MNLSPEMLKERLKNEYDNELTPFVNNNRDIIKIEHNLNYSEIKITISGTSYLVPQVGTTPRKVTDKHQLVMNISSGYPSKAPEIRYIDKAQRAAHPNVFRDSGRICIGDYWGRNSGILLVLQMALRVVTFDPETFGFKSMAQSEYEDFVKKNKSTGIFPTMKINWSGEDTERKIRKKVFKVIS